MRSSRAKTGRRVAALPPERHHPPSVIGIKLVLLLALLATALVCGALPLRRRGDADGAAPRLLEWGNAFAAGGFLGAGFVPMLPDAPAAGGQLGWDYPIGLLLPAGPAAFLVLF